MPRRYREKFNKPATPGPFQSAQLMVFERGFTTPLWFDSCDNTFSYNDDVFYDENQLQEEVYAVVY